MLRVLGAVNRIIKNSRSEYSLQTRLRLVTASVVLTSPVPLALLLLLDLPLEMLVGFGLLVLLQLSHVALLVPLRLVQVPLRREEKR